MIRTFLFDLGNVLVHFSHDRMIEQLADVTGIGADRVRRMLMDEGLYEKFDCGAMTEEEFHARFEALAGRKLSIEELRRAGSDIFTLNTSMTPVVQAIKSAGFRLVLLSNTCVSHFEHVRQTFDVLDHFDEFVLSYRVGATKREPAIFKAALAAIRCAPEECFYTDDIATYVLAAREYGLQAEVFTGSSELIEALARVGVDLEG